MAYPRPLNSLKTVWFPSNITDQTKSQEEIKNIIESQRHQITVQSLLDSSLTI